jgi:ribonuclease P protein component
MLARSERLSRSAFTAVFASGKRIHGDCVTIVFTSSPTFHGSVVVSKKVTRKAVSRNTLRRRIYSQLQKHKVDHTGVYIVILKPPFALLTRLQAKETIENLLAKITHPSS